MSEEERAALLAAMQTLMMAGNMGDVHDALIQLHRLAGLPEPEGDFLDGWTPGDYAAVGFDAD